MMNGSTSVVHVSLADESKGTENLFLLAPILMKALSTGETVVIDEIERSLHPLLVKHIIGYFNDPDINPSNAQLIFNTHNLELMSLDIFRRDQIYFVDKSGKTGASELYSLDEFSVRAEENIKKGYLLGRFGAISFHFGGLCQMKKRRFSDKQRGKQTRKRKPIMFLSLEGNNKTEKLY
jgi:AAA15 family ATPase/GTPase